MAKYVGPKCRQCRREGEKLFLKGEKCFTSKCPVEDRAFPPGQHVYVGDGLSSDVTPARSCGMKTIAVGSRIPEADCSVDRVHEIEKLLL